MAHRLLFSDDLGGMEGRLRVAAEQPYRPRLTDPECKRERQLRKGMLVQGHDPSAGIRAIPRQRLLQKQHFSSGSSNNPSHFQDLLANFSQGDRGDTDFVLLGEDEVS